MDQYTKVGSETLAYDHDGNLVSRTGPGGTTSYSYDALGRLVHVASPAGTWSYSYDAFGNLEAMVADGQRTTFEIDPTSGRVLGSFGADASSTVHYLGGPQLAARVDAGGGTQYFNFDGRGNTTELTGQNGAVLDSYRSNH